MSEHDRVGAEAEDKGSASAEGPGPERIAALLAGLVKAARAHQIYQGANPIYQRFVTELHDDLSRVWGEIPVLDLRVEEDAFVWQGERFAVGEGRESLPFLFYKDGIRLLTFHPGFEDEVPRFLEVLGRARLVKEQTDDLITLLWEADLEYFRAGYIDQLTDAVELPESGPGLSKPISTESLRMEVEGAAGTIALDGETAEADRTAQETPTVVGIGVDDFEETLFFLDGAELEQLREEMEREWRRDVEGDVIAALFDRLEDPLPGQQSEILDVLHQVLPTLLGGGDLAAASILVQELRAWIDRLDPEATDLGQRASALLAELSEPSLLGQLVSSIEEGVIDPDAAELGVFLQQLRPEALPQLIRASELTDVPGLRDRFRSAIEGIARNNAASVVRLLNSDDPVVAAGAAGLAGRLALGEAVGALTRLAGRPDADLRLAAVEALVALRSAATIQPLLQALEDENRSVRIAAVRGIGGLGYAPARSTLEKALEDRTLRDADLTEKIAFFEAYAAVAAAAGVAPLDRLLNGRGLIGGRQPAEIRACAARALGVIGVPAAVKALRTAESDRDPLVRNAVQSALKGRGS